MRVSRIGGAVAMLLAVALISICVGVLRPGHAYAASSTGANQQDAFDYFVKQGLPPLAAAGLVGNLDFESAGVDPTASQCGSKEVAPPRGFCGVGIAQWTWGQGSGTDRWQDLVGLANIAGVAGVTSGTEDPKAFPPLTVQEQFVWQELTTTYRPVLAQLDNCARRAPASSAIECATYAVQKGYEVPQNDTDENPAPGCASPPGFCTRYSDAEAVYDAYAPPVAPDELTAAAASTSAVKLTWLPSPRASRYQVRRNGSVVGVTGSTSFTDAGLTPGGSYHYTVEAGNAVGPSAQSIPLAATTVPAAPSLSASARTLGFLGGTITLVASAVGATSFSYSYSAASGTRRIKGWSPGVPLVGRGAELPITIPPNASTQPATYAFTATGSDHGGTSGSRTITVTVGGKRPAKAVETSADSAAADSDSDAGAPSCWCAIPAGPLLGVGHGGGRASGGGSAPAAPAARGR